MFDINSEKAKKLVKGLQIPARPETLAKIHDEECKESPDINFIADVIASDVGLAASVLKTINSPVFGLHRTVSDIQQSVMLLGLKSVTTLVTFYEMRNVINGDSAICLDQFWESAVDTARLMVVALNQLNLKRDCPVEDVYTLGLFHDCGMAIMAMRFDDYNHTLHNLSTSSQQSTTALEEQHYSTNHAIVGYFAATSWFLPKHICDLILRHHENGYISDKENDDLRRDLYCILVIAQNVFAIYRSGESYSEWERLKEPIFYHLGYSEFDYKELESDMIDEYEQL